MIEALAAGVVALGLLWLVAQPMLFPSPMLVDPIEPPDPEETPRGQALLALKEIEFDRATGKLSDADFRQLHDKYSAAAIAVLEEEPASAAVPAASDAIEALISQRVQAMAGGTAAGGVLGPRCLSHGTASSSDALFCPTCGAGLLSTAGTCLHCGHGVPLDAGFCPGCGVAVRR
jgi:hypothetical protein